MRRKKNHQLVLPAEPVMNVKGARESYCMGDVGYITEANFCISCQEKDEVYELLPGLFLLLDLQFNK